MWGCVIWLLGLGVGLCDLMVVCGSIGGVGLLFGFGLLGGWFGLWWMFVGLVVVGFGFV